MPYKLLFLDQFGTIGGGQRVLLDALEALDPYKFTPTVALHGKGDFREELKSSGRTLLNLPLGDYRSREKSVWDMVRFCFRTLLCSVFLIWSILRHQFDLLIANGPRTFVCATLAGWVTRRPVVWHLHNVLPSGVALRTLIFLSRWVDRILVCSKTAAEPLLKHHPELQSKIRLVYNPFPRWHSSVPTEELMVLRQNLHLEDGFFCFGILGRVTPFKGQICFIDAAKRVLQQFERAYFFVIGGPAADDPRDQIYYNGLQFKVKKAGLDSRVFFIPHQTKIERYYALLDVVVLASQGPEALPRTAIEAMYLGKPVIAPDQEGVREIIENGNTGFLVEQAQPELLADKMLELIHCPEKRESVAMKARNHVMTFFSWKKFERELKLTLTNCLKENRPKDSESAMERSEVCE